MKSTRHSTILLILSFMLAAAMSCGGNQPSGDDGPRGGSPPPANESSTAVESSEVTFDTSDGITIVGTWVGGIGEGPLPACLLAHMLGKDRSTYADFQRLLAEAGISSLAIDMRGHGDSTGEGSVSYTGFSEEQWAAAVNDFKAGLEYLRSRDDVDPAKLCIVGASIGANLAVIAAADEVVAGENDPPACLVLLSPGVSYHGIRPSPRGHDLGVMPVFIASAEADTQSFRGAQSLSQAARGGELHAFEGGAHGTDLFTAYPEFPGELVDWIKGRLEGMTDLEEPSAPDEVPSEDSE